MRFLSSQIRWTFLFDGLNSCYFFTFQENNLEATFDLLRLKYLSCFWYIWFIIINFASTKEDLVSMFLNDWYLTTQNMYCIL